MTKFRMAMVAAATALAMAGSTMGSQAADGMLSPGKPAGVREAARSGPNLWVIGAGVAVAAVVGIVVATQSSNDATCNACTGPATTVTTS